jgi:hypothetical protein
MLVALFAFLMTISLSGTGPTVLAALGPTVLSVDPHNATLNVSTQAVITITIDQALDPQTLSDQTLTVVGEAFGPYAGVVTASEFRGVTEVTFIATRPFLTGERVSVVATSQIRSATGMPLNPPYSWSFTVETRPGPATFALDSTYYSARLPFELFAADVDRDGIADIAVAHATAPSSSLSVYTARGDGSARFDRTTLLRTTAGARGIHAGDYSGDRYPDISLTTALDSSFVVFQNNGAGAFGDTSKYDTNMLAYNIYGADFDADGDMDVSTGNLQGNQVLIAANEDGSFPVFNSIAADSSPRNMEAFDIDDDGDRDLIAVNANGKLSVFRNTGGGAFGPDTLYPLGLRPLSLCVNDLNGDGRYDVAVSNVQGGSISLLFNMGNGNFGAPSLVVVDSVNVGAGKNTLFDVYGGDLDGDGDIDLATANWFTGRYAVLANNGSGTFSVAFESDSVGIGLQNIAGTDPDGDGDLDLVITNWATGVVRVYRNGASTLEMVWAEPGSYAADGDRENPIAARFSKSVLPASLNASTVFVKSASRGSVAASIDYNESERMLFIEPSAPFVAGEPIRVVLAPGIVAVDGQPLAPFEWSFHAAVDQGSTEFTIAETEPLSGPASKILPIDFDADGDLDLVTLSRTPARVSIEENQGLAGFVAGPARDLGGNPVGMALGDVDGDGALEILIADAATGRLRTIAIQGDSLVEQTPLALTGTLSGIVVADLNTDGWDDVLIRTSVPFGFQVIANQEGSFGTPVPIQTGSRPRDIEVLDRDLDGDLDIAVLRGSFAVLDFFENNGGGAFALESNLVPAGADPLDLEVNDVTGDGYPDLMIANHQSADLTRVLSTGNGNYALATPIDLSAPPVSLRIADFDGDGVLDVASISDDAQSATFLFGSGGGQFGGDSLYALPFAPGSLTSGDFMQDGRIDLVVAGESVAMIALLANDPATAVGGGASTLRPGLGHPSPNPAASISRVAYRVATPGHVALRVYNVQGQLVRNLVDSEAPAGEYSAAWDGRDRTGARVGPGVYFFRLESGADSWREKLILLR